MGKRQRRMQRRKNRKTTKGFNNMSVSNNAPQIKPLSDEELEKLIAEHNKGGAFKKQIEAAQQCWDAGIVVRKGCSHMEKPTYQVYFDKLADEKIKKLQDYFPSLEWLAYLVGKVDHEASTIVVEDLVIPDKQQVTGVNVNTVEYSWNEGKAIIGVIHSHHSMGAFFSGTDDAYINQNHDVSIVVSTSPQRPVLGQVRLKAPCGDYVLCEGANVKFNYPAEDAEPVGDMDEFEKFFSPRITTYVYPTFRYNSVSRVGGRSYNYGYGYGGGRSNVALGQQMGLPLSDPYEDIEMTDPSEMTEEDIVNELLKWYSDEEVADFVTNGEAEEELRILQQLEAEGLEPIQNELDDEFDEFGHRVDEDSIWNDINEDGTPVEFDPLDLNGTGQQNGLHQVSYGVPLKDQEDDNVWDLTEDDVSSDDKIYGHVEDIEGEEKHRLLSAHFDEDEVKAIYNEGTEDEMLFQLKKDGILYNPPEKPAGKFGDSTLH